MLLLAYFVKNTSEYPNFKSFIPNGDKVQDPCKKGSIWEGVGHVKSEGGGPRNPFGILFNKNRRVSVFSTFMGKRLGLKNKSHKLRSSF